MSPSALGRSCDTAEMDGCIPDSSTWTYRCQPTCSRKRRTCAGLGTSGERTGSHSSGLGNPRAQGMPPGLSFRLPSAHRPRFRLLCRWPFPAQRRWRAQQPPSCVLLRPPRGRRFSLMAPRGEVASPGPALGAPVTRPVCATLEASGNRVGGPTRSARSRKAPVPTGGRVTQ